MTMICLKGAVSSSLYAVVLLNQGGTKPLNRMLGAASSFSPYRNHHRLPHYGYAAIQRVALTTRDNVNDAEYMGKQQPIVGYHKDEFEDWVAELQCGHFQHVRHNPPMTERPWVLTEDGRNSFLGYPLVCKKCARGEPRDDGEVTKAN